MTKIDDGGPAFPRPFSGADATVDFSGFDNAQSGMSLLDYFAGQALVGHIAGWLVNDRVATEATSETVAGGYDDVMAYIAENVFDTAESMLAERAKRMSPPEQIQP